MCRFFGALFEFLVFDSHCISSFSSVSGACLGLTYIAVQLVHFHLTPSDSDVVGGLYTIFMITSEGNDL